MNLAEKITELRKKKGIIKCLIYIDTTVAQFWRLCLCYLHWGF